jgi:A/G-specific adenine glycosylase
VLVSEVMLQQTPATRVIEPWRQFLESFPTPLACAQASLADVLAQWTGLGYPRRAKALRDSARQIVEHHDGRVPDETTELQTLPGVGRYTASAVASFAYGRRVAVLDTNVGRVLARAVENTTLTPATAWRVAERLLPRRDAAGFNQALIDLGAQFCRPTPRCVECPVSRACRWRSEGGVDPAPRSAAVSRRQAPYAGSDRQLRGRVLAALRDGPHGHEELVEALGTVSVARGQRVLAGLRADGLVEQHEGSWRLATG